MILPIYLEPQPILRQKTKVIKPEDISDSKFQKLIANMIATMHQAKGLGLAAPQIGLGQRLTVINLKEAIDKNSLINFEADVLVMINPYIIKKTFKKNIIEEGCLSIPGVYGTVKRPAAVKIKYFDQSGNPQNLAADNFLARVIQHEIDHLDGILFTDLVEEYSQNNRIIPDYPYI